MHVLLIPSYGKGHNITLTQTQLLIIGLILVLLLPALLGTLTYRINALIDNTALQREPEYLLAQERKLQAERNALEIAKRNSQSHLQALAQRLGHLQAQVLRLNALGARLATLAGLDQRDFNFQEPPALGGPEQRRLGAGDFLQSLDALASHINQKSARLNRLEDLLSDRKLQAAATPLGWPVQGGWVSSGFGLRADPFTGKSAYHEGVDIANKLGAPINAMAAGVVTHAGVKDGYGLTVEINHGRGQSTRYAHAKEVLVKPGDKVERGQAIATVGSSGRSTGPHLHFEVLRESRAVDPASFLKPR